MIPLQGEFIELFYLLFVSGRPCRGKGSTSCAPGKKERRAEPLWRGVLLKKQNVFARAGKSRKEGLFLPKDAARQLAELRRRTGNWRLPEIRSFRRHDEGSCRNIIGQQTSSAAICPSCRTTERCGGRIVRIQFVGGVNVCFSPSGFWQPATRDFVTVQYRPAAFFRQLSAAGACSGLLHAVH